MFGYHGRYLRIDLSSGSSRCVGLSEKTLMSTLGGVGLGARILMQEAPVGVDPLSPAAPVVIAFAPLVGTVLTTSAKFAVVAKSPLTGMLCDGLSGSDFALAGKAMGVDAIVIVGRASRPSIWRKDRLEATDLWGCSAAEAEIQLGAAGQVLAIGVAGERQVRFAGLSNGGRHVGRGGLGAVWGAKNLKALVVEGVEKTSVSDPAGVRQIAHSLAKRSRGEATAKYREVGTVSNISVLNRLGALPTRNFQKGRFEGAAKLIGGEDSIQAPRERRSCARCTIGCEHRYALPGGRTTRVEYESVFALGALCAVDDSDCVAEAIERCDVLGLDTISTGATLAFAMECHERGWMDAGPKFGDGENLASWVDAIGERRGLGDRLAEGTRRLAREMGPAAEAIAPQVKGLEMPGYEPRGLHAQALGYAICTRGADHNRTGGYAVDLSEAGNRWRGSDQTAKRLIEAEDQAAMIDSLILCKFLRGVFVDFWTEAAEMLNAVTGWKRTADDLKQSAQEIVMNRKLFNLREGWRPEDDGLPGRFFDEAIEGAGGIEARLDRPRLQRMIRVYNQSRGWSAEGYPASPIGPVRGR